jgi:hypothetical protein
MLPVTVRWGNCGGVAPDAGDAIAMRTDTVARRMRRIPRGRPAVTYGFMQEHPPDER